MPDFIDVLLQLHIEDAVVEEEVAKARDTTRADLLRRFEWYDDTEQYGMSNDNTGHTSSEPLPYLPPLTEETEDGFVGLDPPMG